MRSFVLFILLYAPKIPLNGVFIFLQQLIIDPDIVVAGRVVRAHFTRLLVPGDCRLVVLYLTTIHNPNLVKSSGILWMLLCHCLQDLNFPFVGGLLSSHYEQTHPVICIQSQDFADYFLSLALYDSLVLINKGKAFQWHHPSMLHPYHSLIVVNGFIVNPLVAQNMSITHCESKVLWVVIDHILVPLDPLLHFIIILFQSLVAECQSIEGRPDILITIDPFLIVSMEEPLVITL